MSSPAAKTPMRRRRFMLPAFRWPGDKHLSTDVMGVWLSTMFQTLKEKCSVLSPQPELLYKHQQNLPKMLAYTWWYHLISMSPHVTRDLPELAEDLAPLREALEDALHLSVGPPVPNAPVMYLGSLAVSLENFAGFFSGCFWWIFWQFFDFSDDQICSKPQCLVTTCPDLWGAGEQRTPLHCAFWQSQNWKGLSCSPNGRW